MTGTFTLNSKDIEQLHQETKRAAAEKHKIVYPKTLALCCMCYKELKKYNRQLNELLPLCTPCANHLAS